MGGYSVVISGASGLIGTALAASLESDGHRVVRLVRREPRSPDEIKWRPGQEPLNPGVLRGASTVVNLNGESIGRLPWTKNYRRVLLESRLDPTRTLANALRRLGDEAPLFVSASAVGFYGDRPGELLTEKSDAGDTFLAQLCVRWEAEALKAGRTANVALIRTAPILHPDATLKPLIALTKLGLGGPLGSGNQVWPWISLDDEVRAIRHIIDKRLTGPINLTGPRVATMNDIGRELAKKLHRPYLLPVPSWALRAVVGADVAESLLLTNADVRPSALEQNGFEFRHPTVEAAITSALAA